jgi:2,5-diamino-6-(ribosylamino)-4(3H)-pyrimidinone 5'-phosphate reductase
MKKPEVIMHNSISLDGRIAGFNANIRLHYSIVGNYQAEIYMAGSNTAKTGIEMYGGAPVENEADFHRPEGEETYLSYWVIPDTRGMLKGMLHALRRNEYCRDVIVLISKQTDNDYVNYLKERNYDFLVCGEEHADYNIAFDWLSKKYNARRILVDSGPALCAVLLKQQMVDRISLLIHPGLAGNQFPGLFEKLDLPSTIDLSLETQKRIDNDYIHMVWQIKKT